MEDFNAQFQGFDAFPTFDLLQDHNTQNIDFLSFNSPCDFTVPTLDNFELDIDSGLEGFDEQLQVFAVDQNFQIPRGSIGPPSALTTSGVSESANSDDLFSDISSFYDKLSANSPSLDSNSALDFLNSQLEMEFQRVTVGSDYGVPQSKHLDESDPTSFGQLPPTPPRSPPAAQRPMPKGTYVRPCFSDYGPPRRSSVSADYFNGTLDFTALPQGTISPVNITAEIPRTIVTTMSMPIDDQDSNDMRRKYRCNHCPRSFARAFNLKTHMATHDPNRLKPHTCSHRNCGRSFSRKHDLQRHLVAIHRETDQKEVGVAAGARSWCDGCGKGAVGVKPKCKCED